MAHPTTPRDDNEYGHHAAKPRPDDTPPRNRVIFSYTTLAVITLAGLSFLFDSYMDISRRGIRGQNIEDSRSSAQLAEYREGQRERLARGAMPIERAMAELGRQDRRAFPLILPAPSTDEGALDGWAQLPRRPAAPPEEAAVPSTEELPQGSLPTDVTLEPPAEGAPTGDVAPTDAAPEAAPTEAAPTEAAPAEAAPTEAAPATGGSIAPGAITPTPAAPRAARRPRPASPDTAAAEAPPSEPVAPPAE